jgi:hypothetical protein
MARYAWVGRSGNGAVVRGVLEAPSREAALAQLKAHAVVVTSVEESGGPDQDLAPGPPAEFPTRPPGAGRPGQSLRDRLFYVMVALAFSALGVGVTGFAPVLRYECRRDVSGAVACHVGRRVCGLVSLAPVDTGRILSVSIERQTQSQTMVERSRNIRQGRSPQESTRLALTCPSGPCWTSPSSSWPMGASNDDIAEGIEDLLAAREPGAFSAWQADKVTLLIAAAFQLPLALVLLGLVLRLTVGRAWSEQRLAGLAADLSRRRR